MTRVLAAIRTRWHDLTSTDIGMCRNGCGTRVGPDHMICRACSLRHDVLALTSLVSTLSPKHRQETSS